MKRTAGPLGEPEFGNDGVKVAAIGTEAVHPDHRNGRVGSAIDFNQGDFARWGREHVVNTSSLKSKKPMRFRHGFDNLEPGTLGQGQSAIRRLGLLPVISSCCGGLSTIEPPII